ncbi:MAG TPA: hypothetical protein PLE77_06800 [Kiritimatiellia bacterium]|nr:hypothetical protein [Kiritimatiellia bacterium]
MRRIAILAAVALGCICAQSSIATASDTNNTLFTSDFETPAGEPGQLPESWELFTSKLPCIGTEPSQRRSGLQSVKFTAQRIKDAHAGLFVKMPVDPRKKYIFSAHVMNSPLTPLSRSAYGQLGIEWHDAKGKEINRTLSDNWDDKTSRNRWEFFQIKTDPPPTATDAHFVIYIYDGDKGDGSFLLDDVSIEER